MRKEIMWLLRSVVGCCLVAMTGCVGPLKYYTAPISDADILPSGTVGEVKNNPKRSANREELQAIQRAIRTNPLLGDSSRAVSGVKVENVDKLVLGFCGQVGKSDGANDATESDGFMVGTRSDENGREEKEAESDDLASVVTGVLRTVEGRLLAYDLRYGEQAQLRCSYMQFWPDTKQ